MSNVTPTPLPSVHLKPGRDKALRHRHPWVFSGAVARHPKDLAPGELVDVYDSKGRWLARGTSNLKSSIRVRAMTWDRAQAIDEMLVIRRIKAAIERRGKRPGRRLVHLEADGLPGLIVDQYGEIVCVQILSPLMERWRDTIVGALRASLGPACIYERSDSDQRKREGMETRKGLLFGAEPPEIVEVPEGDGLFEATMLADVRQGQKTGFFLDQRENRWRVAAHCAGKRVLNCFSYTGGFAIAAMAAGAHEAVNVDVSADALATATEAAVRNGITEGYSCVKADVFEDLRARAKAGESWDVVVLDPPKFARGKATLKKACRGYKDINMMAMRLLKPGGMLATFSCSGLVTPPLFRSVVAGAAVDARRDARIVERLSQPADHPTLMTFPESEYLKGLILRVD